MCWGACATAFCVLSSITQFYVLRFLLGVAESGAFPGMWYQLYQFYPLQVKAFILLATSDLNKLLQTYGHLCVLCTYLDPLHFLSLSTYMLQTTCYCTLHVFWLMAFDSLWL